MATSEQPYPSVDAQWTRWQLERNLNRVLSPAVCHQALEELARADSDFSTIANLLQGDPFVAARATAMANLKLGPEEPPITSIERAVQVLGMRQVHALLVSVMLVGPLLSADQNIPRRKDLWRWIFGCAAAEDCLQDARAEADGRNRKKDKNRYHVGGLLLGLGPLVLHAGLGREYGKVLGSTLRPIRLVQREQNALAVNHHQVTLWALEAMRCPPEFGMLAHALAEDAARESDESDRQDDATVRRARTVEMLGARLAGFETSAADTFLADALPRLGIEPTAFLARHTRPMRRRVRDMAKVFELDLGDWEQREATRQEAMLAAAQTIDSLLMDSLSLADDGDAPAATAIQPASDDDTDAEAVPSAKAS